MSTTIHYPNRSLLIVILLFSFAMPLAAQRKPTPKKRNVEKSSTSAPASENPIVADVSLARLPPRYVGDNAGILYQKLAALGGKLKKSEFETTTEYEKRLNELVGAIKVGSDRSANDRLSFVHPYGRMSYDADAQLATFKFDVRSDAPKFDYASIDLTKNDRSLGSRVGRTAIGIRKRINVWAYSALRLAVPRGTPGFEILSSSLKFHVPVAEAREASGKLWLAISGHLVSPFLSRENDVDNATLDDPEEAHYFHFYLYFGPDSMIVYNALTGRIYATWNLNDKASVDRSDPERSLPALPGNNVVHKRIIGQTPLGSRCVVQLLERPEPHYTEQARAAQVSGTVALSILLGSKPGEVTDIRVIRDLPHGLSDRAIEAAKQIKFVPAELDGRSTPCRINIEYSFSVW